MTRLVCLAVFFPLLAAAVELKISDFVVDTPGLWSEKDGVITGKQTGLKHNDFLRTKKSYANFRLSYDLQLVDGKGNTGVQFRSKPVPDSHEVSGYQADVGEKFWGALYDESRRNKVLQMMPAKYDAGGWNKFVITAEGNHITIELNGQKTVDYRETEVVDTDGFIALQVHSGPGVEVHFKNLMLTELPPGPAIGQTVPLPGFAELAGPKGLYVLFVRSADW